MRILSRALEYCKASQEACDERDGINEPSKNIVKDPTETRQRKKIIARNYKFKPSLKADSQTNLIGVADKYEDPPALGIPGLRSRREMPLLSSMRLPHKSDKGESNCPSTSPLLNKSVLKQVDSIGFQSPTEASPILSKYGDSVGKSSSRIIVKRRTGYNEGLSATDPDHLPSPYVKRSKEACVVRRSPLRTNVDSVIEGERASVGGLSSNQRNTMVSGAEL